LSSLCKGVQLVRGSILDDKYSRGSILDDKYVRVTPCQIKGTPS
jgi:hypothetical protein